MLHPDDQAAVAKLRESAPRSSVFDFEFYVNFRDRT